jgi:hypothetical protein
MSASLRDPGISANKHYEKRTLNIALMPLIMRLSIHATHGERTYLSIINEFRLFVTE